MCKYCKDYTLNNVPVRTNSAVEQDDEENNS